MFEPMRRRITILSASLAAIVAVPAALAATKHGITPTSPKAGATVKAGSRPTFRGTVKGPGKVWIVVSSSRRRNGNGVIGLSDKGNPTRRLEVLQRARREGDRFQRTALRYDYDGWWLNDPGTYYWQAHRVACGEDGTDCYQEGPVVKFRVR
jgi:hypothetical protein